MLWTSSFIFGCFFLHSRVETEKEQPILRGKEVEGKLLIGCTEHSCVLLPPPQHAAPPSPKFHLSESAVHCNREAAPETNTYCKYWWQYLQKIGHLPESSIRFPASATN